MIADQEFSSLLGEVQERLVQHGHDRFDSHVLRRCLRVKTTPVGMPESAEPGRGIILPAVSLPARAELAEEARQSRRLWEIYQVRDWVQQREPVPHGQVLSGDDAVAFATAFLVRPEMGTDRGSVTGDDPAVLRLWELAIAAGAVEIRHAPTATEGRTDAPDSAPDSASENVPDGQTLPATAVPVSLEDSDDEVLRMWRAGFDWTTQFAEHRGRVSVLERHSYRTAERVLGALLFELYVRRGPLDMAGAVTRLLGDLVGDAVAGETMSKRERANVRTRTFAAVNFALIRLTGHGAIRRGAFGNYELTPLGLWGMNGRLSDSGHIVPVRGSLASAPAETLLRCLVGYTGRERMVEFNAWRSTRSDERAAIELLTAADGMGPGDRVQALVLLDRLSSGVEAAIRDLASHANIGPHCRSWLAARDHSTEVGCEDRAHVLVDEIIAASWEGSPEEFIAGLRGLVSSAQHGLIPVIPRIPHPSAGEALRLLFELHPDPDVTAVTGILLRRQANQAF